MMKAPLIDEKQPRALVALASQPAGPRSIPASRTGKREREQGCSLNPQAGKPALQKEATHSHGLPIAILGVPFANVTTSQAIELIEQMIASRRPNYLVTANVDFLVQAQTDVELRRILFDAHLVLCDGAPLLWASRLLGNPLPERVAGSDLAPLLIRIAAEKGYRLFFLGAT